MSAPGATKAVPRVIELASLPSLAAAYARAAFARKPAPDPAAAVPPLEVRVADVVLAREHLARYRSLCGFPPGEGVPATYPQLPGTALMAQLFLAPEFPVKALGLVHRSSEIRVLRKLAAGERVAVICRLAECRFLDRGVEVDLATRIETEGSLAWESVTTVLAPKRGPRAKEARREKARAPAGEEAGRTRSTIWRLPASTGRRYAAVSGDYNPIHLFGVTARLFGFKRPIAHGLYTLARCLAELDADVPSPPYAVRVQFKRPVFLPARVSFSSGPAENGVAFSVRSADGATVHLTGTVSPGG